MSSDQIRANGCRRQQITELRIVFRSFAFIIVIRLQFLRFGLLATVSLAEQIAAARNDAGGNNSARRYLGQEEPISE